METKSTKELTKCVGLIWEGVFQNVPFTWPAHVLKVTPFNVWLGRESYLFRSVAFLLAVPLHSFIDIGSIGFSNVVFWGVEKLCGEQD